MRNEKRGVIVGCDHHQEWLLPGWWENYTQENSMPVAFADFGMTLDARKWCEERGYVFAISQKVQKVSEKYSEETQRKMWEKHVSFWPNLWDCRESWFKKPLALLLGPFETGLWLDADCQVLGRLEPIFDYIDPISGMAVTKEKTKKNELFDEFHYNSGVVAFNKSSPLLKKWIDGCREENDRFLGDDYVLSSLINAGNEVGELPTIYNCLMGVSNCIEPPVVLHWLGTWKGYLRLHPEVRILLLQANELRVYNEYILKKRIGH